MVRAPEASSAISALERAIATLKASKSSDPSSYLQSDVSSGVQTALLMADALGITTDKKAIAFLAQPTDDGSRGVPNWDYEFKSGEGC